MRNLSAIGSKILVGLPEFKLVNIPAKVDTGAYTSSIWASNFKEVDGVLEFTLFSPDSPYYTGKVIKTKKYRMSSVRSSFGHRELRYMVNMKVKIGSRIILTTFSLADRGANRYPVLIGRRTIKGKFLVDVTKNTVKDSYKVLVLDFKPIGSVTRFFQRIHVSNPKLQFVLATHSDLIFQIENGVTKVTLAGSGQNVADFDLVFIKSVMIEKPVVVALAKYLDIMGVPYIDRANSFYPLNNKLAQYIELGAHGIPIPKTMLVSREKIKESFNALDSYLGLPFVLKDMGGSKGRDNYLIRNSKDFKKAVKKSGKKALNMLAQEYIENDGDYRLVTFGGEIQLVINRCKGEKTHLNNTSAGGSAELVESNLIPKDVQEMSLKAVELLKLDVAGVDMMQAKKDGSWYCLEVNHGPQITSGSFVYAKQEKFADFLRKRLEKGV